MKIRFLLGAVLILAWASTAVAGDLEVSAAWIPQPPPGTNAAAYMTIHNAGDAARSVVGVHCPVAERAMIHETKVEDGVAKMRHLEKLEVPAGGTVVLEPGGIHVMLIQPKLPEPGESTDLVLELDGGESLPAAVAVHEREGSHGGGHAHH